MLEVADVFRQYGDTYLQKFGRQMLPSHRRAFNDILLCRTAAMGEHVYSCDHCEHQQYAYHSCKNRSCPKCQGDETDIWLEKRRQEMLATPHFHLVFTLPKELHVIVRPHQKKMYGVLMKAAAHSLMKLAAEARYIYKTAFSNRRLIAIDRGKVTFRYQKCGQRKWRKMQLPVHEFMRRFLQHVLPRGTHKVRYSGIWNPANRQLLRRVQLVTGASQLPVATQDDSKNQGDALADEPIEKRRTCPHCRQGTLILIEIIPRQSRAPP